MFYSQLSIYGTRVSSCNLLKSFSKQKSNRLIPSVAARREMSVVGGLQQKHLSSPNSEISTLALPEEAKAAANAFPSNWQKR